MAKKKQSNGIDMIKNMAFAEQICKDKRVAVDDVMIVKSNLAEAYDHINKLKDFVGKETYEAFLSTLNPIDEEFDAMNPPE